MTKGYNMRNFNLFVFILGFYSSNALLAQDDGSSFEQEEEGSEFSEDDGSGGYTELVIPIGIFGVCSEDCGS